MRSDLIRKWDDRAKEHWFHTCICMASHKHTQHWKKGINSENEENIHLSSNFAYE